MAQAWLTFVQARQALAQRLADAGNVFWTDVELGLYLVEALQVWNALTLGGKADFAFTVPPGAAPVWRSLGAMAGAANPRRYSTTDTQVYTMMQYHTLEPPTGGVWTGTTQFDSGIFAAELTRAQNQMLQQAAGNMANITLPAVPGRQRVALPDTVFEVVRARWVPIAASGIPAITLLRTDGEADMGYQSGYGQATPGTPTEYNVGSGPPLSMGVDVTPAVEGFYDLLVIQSAPVFAPPAATGLVIPNDLAWVAKWGALAALLGRESEATDRVRAAFCAKRYEDGKKLMRATPWLMLGYLNGIPADLPAAAELDGYSAEWDAKPNGGEIVTAGLDFFCVVPDPVLPTGVLLTVLGNAPVPVLDGDFVQVSREVWDPVLDYAQFLATFKMGGYEFTQAEALEKQFMTQAVRTNTRLSKLGLFADVYQGQGQREQRVQERE